MYVHLATFVYVKANIALLQGHLLAIEAIPTKGPSVLLCTVLIQLGHVQLCFRELGPDYV